MSKYKLPIVYRAAALDELERMLQDELALSVEDLETVRETFRQIRDPDATFSIMMQVRDNLNVLPAQDNLSERVKVLEAKIWLLEHLIKNIENTYFSVPDSEEFDCPF